MELLTVIVILGVIAAITVSVVLKRIEQSTKNSFEVQAKIVLRTISDKMLEVSGLNAESITLTYLKTEAKLATSNYESIKVKVINDKPFVILYGKNDWVDLVAYGTYDNVTVSNTTDYTENTVAPTITLVGDSAITIGKNSTYVELGVTYSDDVDNQTYLDNNYSISGEVKTNIPGDYTLQYTVFDSSGNKSSVERTVTVLDYELLEVVYGTNGSSTSAKTRSTSVTVSGHNLNASSLKYLWSTATTAPSEASFTSTFTNGGTISSTSSLNGTYYLWVLAKDTNGNATIKKSKSFVLDNEAPSIILNGSSMEIALNSTYVEPGAKAIDSVDGNLTSSIAISGTVNTAVAGTYTRTYQVTDTAGNSKTETRTVTVTTTTTVEGTVYTFGYTGGAQTFTAPETGKYYVELWGASGGTYSTIAGGKGAFTSGNISLAKGTILYIYVGQAGATLDAPTGQKFNGGGTAGTLYNTNSGGGGTDIRLISGTWNNTLGLRSRIMVAGGGGGADGYNTGSIGGSAGGLVGGAGSQSGTGTGYTNAGAGTQTSGGSGGTSALTIGGPGYFGMGGYVDAYTGHGGGGGGGWYGGGHGGVNYGVVGSGAGGSSFISGYSGCNAVDVSGTHTGQSKHYSGYYFENPLMIGGNNSMPAPAGGVETGHSGNGYAKITYIKPATATLDFLVVAGGGGGGGRHGGGGGGGGFIETSLNNVSTGAYLINVGAGGTGSSSDSAGSNGGNSTALGLTAIGGGGGGSWDSGRTGYAGGSGGGASWCFNCGSGSFFSVGIAGQGNSGGTPQPDGYGQGAGGGGAGSPGSFAVNNVAGAGGAGKQSSILGTSYYFAGGGGGGAWGGTCSYNGITPRAGDGGIGGAGGGGFAAECAGTIGLGSTGGLSPGGNGISSYTTPQGGDAGANTGSGGGGGGANNPNTHAGVYYSGRTGGNGGSGIVVIRYLGSQRATGGTITSSGGYTIHTFTTVGPSTFVLYK